MRCPKCTSIEDKVIDSRISKEGSTIRRRRECMECGNRFTTTEMLVREDLVVIKRDGPDTEQSLIMKNKDDKDKAEKGDRRRRDDDGAVGIADSDDAPETVEAEA